MGRLVPIKGIDLLIEALHELPDVELRIAGEGPERERLQHLAQPLGDRIRFEGLVSGKEKSLLLHAADALTLPSRVGSDGQEEGLPTAITEALMHALPGIVSRTGGMPEAITDGYNGFLFAPGDAASLRQAIQRLQKDMPLQQRLRANAFESAQAFCVDRTTATVSRELEQSLRGRQRSYPSAVRS